MYSGNQNFQKNYPRNNLQYKWGFLFEKQKITLPQDTSKVVQNNLKNFNKWYLNIFKNCKNQNLKFIIELAWWIALYILLQYNIMLYNMTRWWIFFNVIPVTMVLKSFRSGPRPCSPLSHRRTPAPDRCLRWCRYPRPHCSAWYRVSTVWAHSATVRCWAWPWSAAWVRSERRWSHPPGQSTGWRWCTPSRSSGSILRLAFC